jgi:PBP1b-binding outer membrane lipoprotein LpoB
MKKLMILVAIATVFASCTSDNKSISNTSENDSTLVSLDSTDVDSTMLDIIAIDSIN